MDNWKHRSSGMKCGTCMWFAIKAPTASNGDCSSSVDARGPVGRCRRHAPAISGFPVVFSADWCGDHKLDENKV